MSRHNNLKFYWPIFNCAIALATPYDGEKEGKEAHEKKQNQLKKIEEAKKREKGVTSIIA